MTKLKTCLFFNAVAAGATVSLPHGLNVDNVAVIPDQLEGTSAGFTVTADAVNVTVTNNLAVVSSTYILTSSWHDIDRQFGTRQNNPFANPVIYPVLWQSPAGTYPQEHLTPQPFAEEGGTGGSAPLIGIVNDAFYNAVTHVATLIHTTFGVPASGTITTVVPGALVDNDNFILNDGTNPATTFEFQVTGGFVPVAGRIPIDVTACANANDVRDAIVIAVNLVVATLAITAAGPLAATVNLVNDLGGVAGNVAIINNVAAPGFICVGMAAGTNGSATGMGTGLLYRAENAAAAVVDAACIDAVSTSVVGGNESFDIVFSTKTGGAALAEKGRLSSVGVWSSTAGVFTRDAIISPAMVPGVSLVDNTVAIALRQYSSPTLYFQGSGWDTVAVGPCPVKFQNYVKAGSAAEPQGFLSWAAMIGATAAYADAMQLQVTGVSGAEYTKLSLISAGDWQSVEFYRVAAWGASIVNTAAGLYVITRTAAPINILVNAGLGWQFTNMAYFVPNADGSLDIGSAAARVRCVYTGQNALLATLTPSLSLVNASVALAGAGNQQNSPTIIFQGSGWDTVAVGPCPVKFQNYVKAGSFAGTVGVLSWAAMTGVAAAYEDIMRLNDYNGSMIFELRAASTRVAYLDFYDNATQSFTVGINAGSAYFFARAGIDLRFGANGIIFWNAQVAGPLTPYTDALTDLGTAALRVRCVYTGQNALLATLTPSISLVNTTVALAGAGNQQNSPTIIFQGSGWDTGGAVAVPIKFQNYIKAGSAADKNAVLAWGVMFGAGAVYNDAMRLSVTGAVGLETLALDLVCAGTVKYIQFYTGAVNVATVGWNTDHIVLLPRVAGGIYLYGGGARGWEVVNLGDLVPIPGFDGMLDIGSAAIRVRCVYTGQNALLATLTPSLSLVNASVALAGAGNQQNSPTIIFQGSGWDTGGAVAVPIKFQNYIHADSVGYKRGMLCWAEMIGAEVAYEDIMRLNTYGGNALLELIATAPGTVAYIDFYNGVNNQYSVGVNASRARVHGRAGIPVDFAAGDIAWWTLQVAGPLTPFTDALTDLGTAALRVRTLYAGSDAIGVGTTFGASFVNKTAATAILQQYSPMVVMTGHGWDTAGAGADTELSLAWQQQSIAANPPVNLLYLMEKRGGAAWGASGFVAFASASVVCVGSILGGKTLDLYAGGGPRIGINDSAIFPSADNTHDVGTAALRFKDYYFMGFLDGESAATPAAPADGIGRLYFHDNGVATPNRKTQLCMMCHDGTEILIAESAAY